MTIETFKAEAAAALKAYDKYVVCLEKTPDGFERSVHSMISQAIKAYKTRGPNLRHGIAVDEHVTVILSQTDEERPLCGIYFNLHSPYQDQIEAKKATAKKSPEAKK